MKRRKLLQLIEQVQAETRLEDRAPIHFDNLAIDFEDRSVRFRGRTIVVAQRAVVFPMLNTDHMIILKTEGEVI